MGLTEYIKSQLRKRKAYDNDSAVPISEIIADYDSEQSFGGKSLFHLKERLGRVRGLEITSDNRIYLRE